jgi:hypothetical protein
VQLGDGVEMHLQHHNRQKDLKRHRRNFAQINRQKKDAGKPRLVHLPA